MSEGRGKRFHQDTETMDEGAKRVEYLHGAESNNRMDKAAVRVIG